VITIYVVESLRICSMYVVSSARLKCLARWPFKGISTEAGNQFTGVPHHELLLQKLNWRYFTTFYPSCTKPHGEHVTMLGL
jgi:hypothetical protein